MRTRASVLLIAACAASGCYTPGGGFMPYTGGPTTYYSYEAQPVSIDIIDLRNNEIIFQMDIPPGKQLTFDFQPGKGDDPVYTPDLMRYQVFDQGTTTGRLRNSLTVPAATSRRVDVHLRPAPEYTTPPADRHLRTDEVMDRPDWWTPEGGEMPVDTNGADNYDG